MGSVCLGLIMVLMVVLGVLVGIFNCIMWGALVIYLTYGYCLDVRETRSPWVLDNIHSVDCNTRKIEFSTVTLALVGALFLCFVSFATAFVVPRCRCFAVQRRTPEDEEVGYNYL